MSDHIVMRVKQRGAPGFTPRQRLLRNMGDWYEDQIKDEWETQPSAGKPLGPGSAGDIENGDEPAPKSDAEREQPFWDHLSPWYKDRARRIAGDEADV
jgi:hypothetical protein